MRTKPFIFKSGMTGKKQDTNTEYTTLNLYQIDEKKETGVRYLAYAKRNKTVATVDGKKNYNSVKEDENLFFMYAPIEMPIVKDLFFGDIILVSYEVSDSGTFELIDVSALLYESPYRGFDFASHSDDVKIHAALKYRESTKQQEHQEQMKMSNLQNEQEKSKKPRE